MTNKEITNQCILTLDNKNKAKNLIVDNLSILADEKIEKGSIVTKTNTLVKSQPELDPEYDFNAVYDELHAKFPKIINIEKPVLLAIAIRSEILKEVSIPNVVLRQWIGWYFNKSNYYSLHEIGTIRYNLDGSEAGAVTEKDQAKRDKQLGKRKQSVSTQS